MFGLKKTIDLFPAAGSQCKTQNPAGLVLHHVDGILLNSWTGQAVSPEYIHSLPTIEIS